VNIVEIPIKFIDLSSPDFPQDFLRFLLIESAQGVVASGQSLTFGTRRGANPGFGCPRNFPLSSLQQHVWQRGAQLL